MFHFHFFVTVCVASVSFSAGVKRFKGQTTDDYSSRWNREIDTYFPLVERVVFCVNHVAMTVVGFCDLWFWLTRIVTLTHF